MDYLSEIEKAVHNLKVERDTWKAVALQYRDAFETQTSRFRELHDLHLSLQAEYESEKSQHDRLLALSHRSNAKLPGGVGDDECPVESPDSFGTATIYSPRKFDKQSSQKQCDHGDDPLFERVRQAFSQRNHGFALAQLDRVLHTRLKPKVRVEGLLLKSDILRACGIDELYNALAACSEALELIHRHPDLSSFVTRLHYQRGVIYYQLRMLPQAREAFSAVTDDDDDALFTKAREYRVSCEEEMDYVLTAKRRSGFDHDRRSEDYLAHWDNKSESRRRRTSVQLRHAASKAKRLALPQRWVSSRSDEN